MFRKMLVPEVYQGDQYHPQYSHKALLMPSDIIPDNLGTHLTR